MTTISGAVPAGRWWRIIPPAILVYIFSFMDRTNIGFAMAGGMNEALPSDEVRVVLLRK